MAVRTDEIGFGGLKLLQDTQHMHIHGFEYSRIWSDRDIPVEAFPVAVFLFRKSRQSNSPVELLVFFRRYPKTYGYVPEAVVTIHIFC